MKNRYDLETPDLTPDLEWMLSSGQVSSSLLLEKLLQDYYSQIYQFVYSILDDRQLAGRCTQDVFLNALLGAHKFSEAIGVDVWLHQLAWRQCQKVHRRQKTRRTLALALSSHRNTNPGGTENPGNSQESRLWQSVVTLKESSRWMLILQIMHGRSAEWISRVVGAPIIEVQALLQSAWGELVERWMNAGQEETELGATLSKLFDARWPSPALGEIELEELSSIIGRRVSGRRSRIKPYATIMEVALLALVVLAAGGILLWVGWGEDTRPASPNSEVVAFASATPTVQSLSRPTNSSLLAPRSYPLTSGPTPTPTPGDVLYGSQRGEDLAQIASRLDVSLDDLRRINRIAEHEKDAHGQLLYIPGSLPVFTSHYATPVPQAANTLPLETPASSQEIFRLMYPQNQTFNTVWLDAILFMRPQLPFSGAQDILRLQLWLSDDQALLLGGQVNKDPEEVLLWTNNLNYIAKPGVANPWFHPVDNMAGEMNIDQRLLYGAMVLLKFSYNDQKYQFFGDEWIAGRPVWKITELDEHQVPMAEISLDKETGFLLKYRRDPSYPVDRENRAYLPQEAMIFAIEFDVDFPQDLFNPRLPWRGGYAWDASGEPFHVLNTP